MKNYHFLFIPTILIMLFSFKACDVPEKKKVEAPVEKNSAEYFYNLGLESSDPVEKLRNYNAGLDAVRSEKDTVLVALLEGKIYALNRMGENKMSLVWIDSLITTARLQNDLFYLAKGYYRKSVMNRYFSQPQEEFENAFLSREVYLKMGDTAYAGRRSLDMANAQFGMGDFSGSQETATEALRYLDREKDSAYVSSAYNILGLAYSELGFYKDAKEEYANALSYAINKKDSLSFLHNLALVYKNEKKYNKALDIFQKIITAEEPDPASRRRFLDNYAYTRWLKDPSLEIDKELLQVMQERKKNNDGEGLMASYSHLADYYFSKDQRKSYTYAQAFLQTARENKSAPSEVAALKKLISISEGDQKEEFVNRYLFLNDSLNRSNLNAKYQFAKIRFDEERKQQQISLLEAENLNQTVKSERLQARNTISSLSALLFLLTAATVFIYFSQRSKKEKIKQVYLTEKRISKRIHDELANDIYNVMSTLESVGPTPVVDKLERIYLRTRDFSREHCKIETGENYLPGLLNLLSSTTPSGTKLVIRGEESIPWGKVKTEKKIVLYRVLQELMVNMKKYSGATLVALVFSKEKKELRLSYSDNGIGTSEDLLKNGNGIKNIQDRLRTVNGDISFDTKGKGLKAVIVISYFS